MTEDNSMDSVVELAKDLIDFEGLDEKSHASGERAAEQVVKILGAVHAGLGLTLAAWLQRIFEHTGETVLSLLTWYLAWALFAVLIGLVTVAMTPILDMYQARAFSEHVQKNKARFMIRKEHGKIMEGFRASGSETISSATTKEIQQLVDKDSQLRSEGARLGDMADRLNAASRSLAVASCVSLVASFGIIAVGVTRNIVDMQRTAHQVHAPTVEVPRKLPEKQP